jgi:hypothetical protein
MKTGNTVHKFWGRGGLVLALVLGSCVNQLLPKPEVRAAAEAAAGEDPGVSRSPWGAPEELTASQGKKRAVALSWKPVTGAVRYYVYKSESPLQEFVQCGETADDTPEFEVKTSPGATLYFKVAALNKRNEVSGRSGYAAGRSLAQPVIYSIEPDQTDAGSITVYWSMNNMEANTYEEKVRYMVYCYEGGTSSLKAEIPLGGSFANDPFVKITGLSGSTEYEFEVNAWLEDDAGAGEFSGRIDAETARRMRPGAPENLASAGGKEKQAVTLSFTLPEMVEVLETAGGEKTYVPHPLYFVISRREAGSGGEFQAIRAYFGSDSAKAGGAADFPYVQGETVSWTDSILESQRGVKYEYRVQPYVDGIEKLVSGEAALVTGWAMARPSIAANAPVYVGGDDGSDYTQARLSLNFSHDNQGVDYRYLLKEAISPIGDGSPRDLPAAVEHEYSLSYSELASYAANIDLAQPSTDASRGRGWYAYSIQVLLEGTPIEQVDAVGSVRVFERNTAHIVVKDFEAKDGYTDKFVLVWTWQKDRKYIIKSAAAASGPWTPVAVLPPSDSGDGSPYVWTDTDGVDSGVSRYYSICAAEGDLEGAASYTPELKILGTPSVSVSGPLSYDAITLSWAPVQKADAYRVRYRYADESNFAQSPAIPATSLSIQGGELVYEFKPFGGGDIDAAKAGKNMEIILDALNRARQAADGGGEIKTESNLISGARIFGPAGLGGTIAASENTSTDRITLKWKAVEDAAGYYVVRFQGQLNAGLPGGGETLYYVNAGDKSLTGKDVLIVGGIKADSGDVSAELSYSDVDGYTLVDMALDDAGYEAKKAAFGSYADQQNDIPWGYPYTYYVVPVLSETDRPNIAGNACSVGGARYSAASTAPLGETGRALGFVVGVKATKGTFTGLGGDGEPVNIGVKVTWTKPDIEVEETLSYFVFRRRQTASGDWEQLTTSPISSLFYEDKLAASGGPSSGTVYEYLVGVYANGGGSRPDKNARFIAQSRAVMDDEFSGERNIAGYVLPQPTMKSASRTAQNDAEGCYETVEFFAAGVDSLDSERKDRGVHGYVVQVRDQSHERAWKTIKDIPLNNENPDTYTEKIHNISGLLNVLRDYRHYYRVRTYVDYGGKILSPEPEDPEPVSPDLPNMGLTGAENQYVKWGARPITATEFAGLTSLAIGAALKNQSYSFNNFGTQNNNVSLNERKPFFLTIGGTIRVVTYKMVLDSTREIRSYGNNNTLTFSFSESDVPGLVYNGSVTINGLTSSAGTYSVTFNGETVSVDRKYILTPFTFSGITGKDCNGFYNWNETSGWQ